MGDAMAEVVKALRKRLSSLPFFLSLEDRPKEAPFLPSLRFQTPRNAKAVFLRQESERKRYQDSPQGGAERWKREPPKGGRGFTKRLEMIVTKGVAPYG